MNRINISTRKTKNAVKNRKKNSMPINRDIQSYFIANKKDTNNDGNNNGNINEENKKLKSRANYLKVINLL